ncbi:Uncharacterised protein [Enterobacter hormaechei]|nr:Uncharacterised protein [Enterobacter hormaechei]
MRSDTAPVRSCLFDDQRFSFKNWLVHTQNLREREVIFISEVHPAIFHRQRQQTRLEVGGAIASEDLACNVCFFHRRRMLGADQWSIQQGA